MREYLEATPNNRGLDAPVFAELLKLYLAIKGITAAVTALEESSGGGGGDPGDTLIFIQDDAPSTTSKLFWIQTNYLGNPGDFTVWFRGEDMSLVNVFGGLALDSSVNAILAKLNDILKVKDDYQEAEYLDDQTSDGTVKTFTFTADVEQAWVEFISTDDAAIAQVTTGAVAPTPTKGIKVPPNTPFPILVTGDTVNVLAPNGCPITVWGFRRA